MVGKFVAKSRRWKSVEQFVLVYVVELLNTKCITERKYRLQKFERMKNKQEQVVAFEMISPAEMKKLT